VSNREIPCEMTSSRQKVRIKTVMAQGLLEKLGYERPF